MAGIVNRIYEKPVISGNGGYSFSADARASRRDPNRNRVLDVAVSELDTYAWDGYPVLSFASLAAVKSAIDDGALSNGQYWSMSWSGDAYHGDGLITGRVVQSRPAWRGLIPTSKLGAGLPSVSSLTGSGALTFDGEGRPILTVGASAGDQIEALIGLKMGPAQSARMVCQLTYGAASSSTDNIAVWALRRDGDPTKRILLAGKYAAGSWYGSYFYQSTGATAQDVLDTDASNASKYAAGKQASFSMTFATTGAQPVGSYVFSSTGDGSGATSAATEAGEGDFTVATQIWEPYVQLRSTGAAGSLLITGLELNTRV